MNTAYCPHCRLDYEVDGNPPYSVVHRQDGTHYVLADGKEVNVNEAQDREAGALPVEGER